MKKMRIAIICQFSNEEIQARLPLWRKRSEFAPWMPIIIKGFEGKTDFEIHVIAPHTDLIRATAFNLRGIYYHFIAYGIPIIRRPWLRFFPRAIISDFRSNAKKINNIVNKINPDIINVIGAEGTYSSSSIFSFDKKYPILITIQGFRCQLKDVISLGKVTKKAIEIEEKILTDFKYYAGEMDSSDFINTYNPTHKFFKLFFPVDNHLILQIEEKKKIYDCVYFGRLDKLKGIEDFIKIISILKGKKSDIKACIIGGGNQTPFINLAKNLNCYQNIEFKGFLKTQKEVFTLVKQSKIFLASPYFERLSSTLREAMYLKVPIVAYATGGIPYINEYSENIYLVDTGDYGAMAKKALVLLEDDETRQQLAEKAYLYALNEFSLSVNTKRLIEAYKELIVK